jgi:hypothetical protein
VPRFAADLALRDSRLVALLLSLSDWKLEIRFAHLPGATQRPGVAALLAELPVIRRSPGAG